MFFQDCNFFRTPPDVTDFAHSQVDSQKCLIPKKVGKWFDVLGEK